ncbi:hypothetical protein ACVWZ4_002500 [Bradyrhizobium sp. USDA 4472]
MINDRIVGPPIARIRKSGVIAAAILLLGPIAASTAFGAGTRSSEGFEPFDKLANERVSEAFEDIKGIASVSDELKTALASLSQRAGRAEAACSG